MKPRSSLIPLVAALGLTGCDTTSVDGPRPLSLLFSVSTAAPSASLQTTASLLSDASIVGPPMALTGSNGTLTIDEIRLVVAEVELEGDDDNCVDDANAQTPDDDCNEVESPPRFVDLPLDGQPVEAISGIIPPGVYDELEFEIEDLEDDEGEEFAQEIAALREAIRDEFSDWPEEASVFVAGTFTTTDGVDTSFRVFIEAEIEVERDLMPPLVVEGSGSDPVELTIDVQPDRWFVRNDGTVLDLSAFDWDTTGELLELEVEIEDGFVDVEVESES